MKSGSFFCLVLACCCVIASESEAPGATGSDSAVRQAPRPQGLLRYDCDDIWQWPEDIGNRADYRAWYAKNCDECKAASDREKYVAWEAENCPAPRRAVPAADLMAPADGATCAPIDEDCIPAA